jgi:hypothetical protein
MKRSKNERTYAQVLKLLDANFVIGDGGEVIDPLSHSLVGVHCYAGSDVVAKLKNDSSYTTSVLELEGCAPGEYLHKIGNEEILNYLVK